MLNWLPAILIRLLVPLAILPWPFWGSLAAILADMTDVVIWEAMAAPNLSTYYNLWDKFLDTYFQLIQGYVAWKFWKNPIAKKTALSLLSWRLIGVLLYELLHYRWLLFIFPNIFLTFFIVYLGALKVTRKDPFNTWTKMVVFVTLLLIPKLYQEYLFHVVEFPLYQTLKGLIS